MKILFSTEGFKDRLSNAMSHIGMSARDLSAKSGHSPGMVNKFLASGNAMGIDKLEKILIVLAKKGINSDWLLTGRGSIEEKESAPLILEEPILTYASRGIPYIRNAIAWCGAGGSFDGSEYVSGWIDLPAYRTCDGAISVEGDSMTPHLEPGDIVLVSAIQDLDSFLPGRMHLVVTREMAQVKYLYPGRDPGTLRLLSAQPRYSELVLHVADVLSIYQVRGRINTV